MYTPIKLDLNPRPERTFARPPRALQMWSVCEGSEEYESFGIWRWPCWRTKGSESWELVSCASASRMVVSSHLVIIIMPGMVTMIVMGTLLGIFVIVIMILLIPWGHRRLLAGGLLCCKHLALAGCLSLKRVITITFSAFIPLFHFLSNRWFDVWYWRGGSPIVHSSSLASLYSITK